MRINTALAAAIVLTGSLLHTPAHAQTQQAEERAQLRLVVVDEKNAAVPAAAVTIFSTDGNPGREVTADDEGVVVLPSLPAGFAQIYARFPGHAPFIEGTRLKTGENVLTVTLPTRPEPGQGDLARAGS